MAVVKNPAAEKKVPKLSNMTLNDIPSLDNHESSSITSSSTIKSSSKKSKRKKGRHKKSRSKSCYYCDNVCEYHMEKIKQKHNSNGGSHTGSSKRKKKRDEEKLEKLEKEMISESVQVGNPNAKYGHGHYLFDPTQVRYFNILKFLCILKGPNHLLL